jgi:arylsulfatase A-like enzyme
MAPDLTRRAFLHTTLAAPATAVAARTRRPPGRRPNLLFILADDMGYGDLSCYGRPDYRTPVLDALARQGVRFTSAYAAGPVCSPTRCAFHTGRYPQRVDVGLREPLTQKDHEAGLPASHPTVGSLLNASGYETALIGKWHLGWKPEFGPNRHGYQEFFGILSGAADYFTHSAGDGPAGQTSSAGKRDLWENLAPSQRTGYLTDLLSDRAVEFVRRRRTRPFYLSLHYTAPHSPWEGPEDAAIAHENHGEGPMIEGGSLKIYASMVRSMDAGIGRVLEAVRRSGLERDTLVIFTSDNGGERYSFNWPFSFQKGFLWEGGIRVPAIARWTGQIPAGGVTDQPAITMDWTATMLAAAGAAPAADYPLDGDDLMPVCRGVQAPYERTLCWRSRGREAARMGAWKYVKDSGAERLFDVVTDPGEKTDVRLQRAAIFEEIKARYRAWNARMLPASPPL